MPAQLRHLSELDIPETTLPEFIPPPRFQQTGFESYRPQHPSQSEALVAVQEFITPQTEAGFRWPWQKKPEAAEAGLYLDGGFGVGKTHLLAAAYNAFVGQKAYLSFAELVYVMGVYGKDRAQAEFGNRNLYCIDEFELDDPGNTLIVKTFLAYVFAQGGRVMTTSNTPPKAQGEGRFNADDFRREIQSIATRFNTVAIGGPDFRQRERAATLLTLSELTQLKTLSIQAPKVEASWQDLFLLLQSLHPIRYGELLKQVGTLYVARPEVIPNQNDALRFVHFIDKLYDMKVGLCLAGTLPLEELFDSSYRNSAYAKKHYRCLSRIGELLDEARAQLALTPLNARE